MSEHYDLTITSSGAGWMGTFAIVVRTLVEDILSDGASFEARITWESSDGNNTWTEIHSIAAVNFGFVITTNDQKIEIDAIRKLEV